MDSDDNKPVDLQASNQKDLEWVSRFKAGNRNAFDFLVRKYQRRLFRPFCKSQVEPLEAIQ